VVVRECWLDLQLPRKVARGLALDASALLSLPSCLPEFNRSNLVAGSILSSTALPYFSTTASSKMPTVLSYTPAWLARPSPGYHMFAPKPSTSQTLVQKEQSSGLRKNIATRQSEIFVAAGHELRWADLAQLKEEESPIYRTLRIPIPLPIERLTISPSGEYLAVSTSHTVHIVCLPSYDVLNTGDDSPLKPKTFQVGPTAHVLEESQIASVIWHPLGYHDHCLVTITQAGVVRLWEINRADRSTFSEPTLSIDLEKLANAETDQEDLGASKLGTSKGFSPDSVDLEVASACFGDLADQEGVHGWAPMTLWIATISGAVYALCPLLPSKWQLAETPGATTFMQTLTSSININYADVTEDANATRCDKVIAEKQHSWMNDILYQEPLQEELSKDDMIKVFARPTSVPAVPLLQGPFSIMPEVEDFELSDMTVYSFKTFSSGTEEAAAEGLPAAVVCLLTDTCQVHVCLDLEGIVGKWLPSPEVSVKSRYRSIRANVSRTTLSCNR
jgi:nucleoporin NUP82